MKISIFTKIIGGLLLAGGSIAAITIATIKLNANDVETQTEEDKGSESVLEKDSEQDTTTIDQIESEKTEVVSDIEEQNKIISFFLKDSKNVKLSDDYQCKFQDEVKFDCSISAIKILSTEKNHSKISDLLKNNVDANKTTDKDIIYKISVKESKNNSAIDWNENGVDIFDKKATKKIQTSKILFAMVGNEIHKNSKTDSFVFNIDSQKTINVDASEKNCSITETVSASASWEDCFIYDFGKNESEEDDLDNWTFEEDEDENVSLEENKYYVITLSNEINIKNNQRLKIKTTSDVEGIDFSINAAFIYEYGSDNDIKSHLFILR